MDAVIVLGDFNSKNSNWKCNYLNRNDDIDNAIDALTNHIGTVVESSSRTIPAKSDRRELPRYVIELIRDKNTALHRAGKYPTCKNRSHVRTLQRAVPTPALKRPDNSIAFDDREKADCLADSIEHQCSDNLPYDLEYVRRVEEEVRHRVSPPKTIWIQLHMTKAGHDIRKSSFAHVRPDIVYDLQTVQNKFCRRPADAPRYIKNSVIHRDLELPTISKFMKDASARFFDVASSHPNLLLVSAVSYEPTPPHHFCRRPRNILIDPPDDLTVELEKLIELNKMAIN
ncbi:hypothetical protein EVAR_63072_1 [Eumeta japonica]|uniref:RNA-directed DNA polymerase from mobile element jockey n=1 Tax=Eumeta variegata TaxID=151549 RepID=A0A4C1Z9T0_EUMVA|nr:hypothetical protein EVAR_63072_1 [Eumeta japonica]